MPNPVPNQSIRRNNLKTLRLRARLSQAELATLLSSHGSTQVDPSTISYHENGVRLPSRKDIEAYARVFKVPEAALYRDIYDTEALDELLTQDIGWTEKPV